MSDKPNEIKVSIHLHVGDTPIIACENHTENATYNVADHPKELMCAGYLTHRELAKLNRHIKRVIGILPGGAKIFAVPLERHKATPPPVD